MSLNKQKGNMYGWVSHTWNPIGGRCPHQCSYCLGLDTMVLMSDFSEKPIQNVSEGDTIIGIYAGKTGYRRYRSAPVTRTSVRKSHVLRISTQDDEIVATPEHPFLAGSSTRSSRDWLRASAISPYYHLRYVGRAQVPDADFIRGWLSGYIEGDGCLFNFRNQYSDKDYLGFEAVSIDESIRDFLKGAAATIGVQLRDGTKSTTEKSYSQGKSYDMVFTRSTPQAQKLQAVSRFLPRQSPSYYAGYLGGIFDAEGSIDKGGNIRIHNTDASIRAHIEHSANALGIGIVSEPPKSFRLSGALSIKLRMALEMSKCLRKQRRLLLGRTIKGTPAPTVVKVEALGTQEVFNLETECSNFIANGFIVHNCYMKGLWRSELRLRENFLQDNLADKTIFVGSSTDMWADAVPSEWIEAVLERCQEFPETTFLFQSKNPKRFFEFEFPTQVILGTTLESNRGYEGCLAPRPVFRVDTMYRLEGNKMVSIEPVMDFDLPLFLHWLKAIEPTFVSIGADSKGHGLPEPSGDKLEALITALKSLTEVKLKSNLARLRK